MDLNENTKLKELFHKSTSQLEECMDYVNKYLDGEDKETQLNILKDTAKKYCEDMFNYEKRQFALEKVRNKSKDNFEIDVKKELEETLAEDQSTCDYTKYEFWNRMCEDQGDASIVEVINTQAEETNYERVDDSLLCSQVFTPPLDPITKQVIKNPCKNKICGHVYEYQIIVDFVKQRGTRKAKCPYVGCKNKNMKENIFVKDANLKVQIENYLNNTQNHNTT